MELKELVGEHKLTAVEIGNKSVKAMYGDGFEDANFISFTLDGITYTAIEDPDDGYRSSMREISVSETKLSNSFKAQRVVGSMRPSTSHDVIDFIDSKTGKVVLSVGTGDIDDYYPFWVAEFSPENMGINANN